MLSGNSGTIPTDNCFNRAVPEGKLDRHGSSNSWGERGLGEQSINYYLKKKKSNFLSLLPTLSFLINQDPADK